MNYEYDKVYINDVEFPYSIDGVNNTIPPIDASQNDLDIDSYTNLKGKVVRNRVRSDVKTLDFNVSEMSGSEMKKLMAMRKPVWFNCTFFDESAWDFVTKKMYCSSPKYTKYYIDKDNPLNNIYTDIQFSFVEE